MRAKAGSSSILTSHRALGPCLWTYLAKAPFEEIALRAIVCKVERPLVGKGGLAVASPPAQKVGANGVIEVVAIKVEPFYE